MANSRSNRVLGALRTGAASIWAHKLRSMLSLMGIAIGVASLLYTFIQLEGKIQSFETSMSLIGDGPLQIEMSREDVKEGFSAGLTHQDAQAIRKAFPNLRMVSATKSIWGGKLMYEGEEMEGTERLGITPEWTKTQWVYTQRGRFITQEDVDLARRVCVLVEEGEWPKEDAFWLSFVGMKKSKFQSLIKHVDMLGKTIVMGGHSFSVVGILKEPPRNKDPRKMNWGSNPSVLIPLSTALLYYGTGQGSTVQNVDNISIDTGSSATLEWYKRDIEKLLLSRHQGVRDFEVRDWRQFLMQWLGEVKRDLMSVLILGIVCLVTGGVGIMNVTIATIYSRIKEIGIRRAIGASRADILMQFVLEASLLGLLGGCLGILLGHVGVHFFIKSQAWAKLPTLSIFHYLGALGIAAGTGFIFSVFPAYQAAKMDPVTALRYE